MANTHILKSLAPFLDPHILLKVLQTLKCDALAKSLQSNILLNQKSKNEELKKTTSEAASKIKAVFDDQAQLQKLKHDHNFTLETLSAEKDIESNEFSKLFAYAKVLYELGEYEQAEKYLYELKELFQNIDPSSPQANLLPLYMQVLWGLLAVEIVLQKDKDLVEKTFKLLREQIERINYEVSVQENMNQKAWLLHWIMVHSFTQNNIPLFDSMLTDKQHHNHHFLNIIAIQSPYMISYLVAALLKHRRSEALQTIALSLVMEEQEACSNALTQFVVALYNDFNFDKALTLAKKIEDECQKDIFLAPLANELKRSAQFLVFDILGRLNSHVDLKYVSSHTGQDAKKSAAFLEELAKESGLTCAVDHEKSTLKIIVPRQDIRGKIEERTKELALRTKEVNRHLTEQSSSSKK